MKAWCCLSEVKRRVLSFAGQITKVSLRYYRNDDIVIISLIHFMKKFLFDIVLDKENICNLQGDRRFLSERVSQGKRIVFYGRRNTGKTSLVKSILIPQFYSSNKKGLVVFADFMGVKSIEQINSRLKFGLEKALNVAQPTKGFLKNLATAIKGVRPTFTLDPVTGSPIFSLGLVDDQKDIDLKSLFEQISFYHKKKKALIIMDEFQDISFVPEAEGIIRNILQNLPGDLPVLILGSKKHLLAKIFSSPDSPLAGWGIYREISTISTKDYHKYIEERFEPYGLKIDLGLTRFIQDQVQNIPESINILCEQILRNYASKKTKVTEKMVFQSLRKIAEERSGFYEERLLRYTEKERRFFTVMAKLEPVTAPNSKLFLQKTNLSPGGNRPILQRLEAEAAIYRASCGYVLSDPLLAYYLRMSR